GERDAAIHGGPAHDFGMHEVQRMRAHLPDAAVGLRTASDRGLDDLPQESPVGLPGTMALCGPAPTQLQHQPVHVRLELALSGVANTRRSRAAPPFQIGEYD